MMDNKLLNEVKRSNILNGESAIFIKQQNNKARQYWHYTSLSALLSIFKIKKDPCLAPDLTRCEMLASNICYLNDIKEFNGGVEDFKKMIECLKNEHVDMQNVSDDLQDVSDDIQDVSDDIQDVSDDIYIISFCGNGDLLSNWKYYAKDCGVSIQFNMENVEFKYTHHKKDEIIAEDWYEPIPVEFKDGDVISVNNKNIGNVFGCDNEDKSIDLYYSISRKSGYNELRIKLKEEDPWSGPIIVKINRIDNKDEILINKGSVSIYKTGLLEGVEGVGDECVERTPIVIKGKKCKLNSDIYPELIDKKSKPIAVAYSENEKKAFIVKLMKKEAEGETTVADKSVIKYIAIPCFKNQGFSEEKESRLLFYKYDLKNKDIVFNFDYNTNNPIKIKPALRVQFLAKDSEQRLINKIIVGPGENQNMVFNTLIHIFDRDNYMFYDDEKFKEQADNGGETKAITEKEYIEPAESYKSIIKLVKWSEEIGSLDGTKKEIKRWSYKCANGIIIMKSSIPFRG